MADEVATATRMENLALAALPAPNSLATRTLAEQMLIFNNLFMLNHR